MDDSMEVLKFIISILALGIALWNFQRLRTLDTKNEYKDKRYLYQECLDEAKLVLEKIIASLAKIENLRDEFNRIESPYAGSVGGNEGHKFLINNLTQINQIKEKVTTLYKQLDEVIHLSDKVSFNRCIDIRKELKDHFLDVSPKLYETENLVQRMILLANIQKA